MKCDNCSCTTTYIKKHKHTYIIRGKEITFISSRRFCQNCNNLIYDSKLDNEAGYKALEIYNQKYGIEKEKIINLRKQYQLSQAQFAKIIGCAKKTLISYEKGTAAPNENYVILINTLLLKPDIIKTLIEANKRQFTDMEYQKIQQKVSNFVGNNTTQFLNQGEFIPTEYNGYTKLNKEKIINMILYFANQCVLKTKLLKEMFYADFLCYKNTGASITGLEYAKLPHGPVPDDFENIINKCTENKFIHYKIEYKNEYEHHKIESIANINVNCFTKEEYEIIKKVKEYFQHFSSKKIEDFSHKEKAYIETDSYKKISYDYAFDIDHVC